MSSIQDLVHEWISLDKNEDTRNEIQQLWDAGNLDELERRMRPRIEFGTAGLRGRMEAGWSRMNDLIILQTTQGLCAYTLAQIPDAASRGVVIGHDHRHNSERWAQLAASVFLKQGVKTYLMRGFVHTPIIPFSVRQLKAACGIMITASHNPKQDNGYKVYWENAVQIIEPHDKGIAESIKHNLEPTFWTAQDVLTSSLCIDKTPEMIDAYFTTLSLLNTSRPTNEASPVKFVNTSMHGVSDAFLERAFKEFGFSPYIPVLAQQHPDPEFPTVRFPNPEERALDLAIQTANAQDITYVIAQDPDSDRFAAAERSTDGSWVTFTGDQLGSLFAAYVLDIYISSNRTTDKLAMVASTVSSKMIEAMAKVEGFRYQECLTGFKYIGNTALDLVKEGFEVPFGYEEAIGYMLGSDIRDKDGVAAAVCFAQLAARLHTQGKTVMSYLQELYARCSFQTSNSYFICDDPSKIDDIFGRLRKYNSETVPSYPSTIAGLNVTRVVDLTTGYDSGNPPTYKPQLPISLGHMIQFRAEREGGLKVVLTIRTSGTEPKIKYYLEAQGDNRQAVMELLPLVVNHLGNTWMEAEKNNLGRP
ncbi:hypothetical protein AMATHDRAFT_77329 [Amanita thiersii Skay4041]|uniref:Phosphoglucomutase n=1 Tax=Amanita thiersii Skay4041 TaxID=703135 RepID=A0A2A9NHB6_9AGAR|nr:hypothetical protein AMATHDRAFT_77329 [Amanita thiersii Skay4041]